MTPVAERLTAIRSRVRQHHTLVAAEMIDTLIADVEREAELQRIVNTPSPRRTNGRKPDCPYGWKYGAKGRMRNRKHTCGPECSWTAAEALASNPPYSISTPDGHIVTVQSRIVPVPPCANCDRRRSDHWEPAADKVTGRLTGYRAIKECQYEPKGWER